MPARLLLFLFLHVVYCNSEWEACLKLYDTRKWTEAAECFTTRLVGPPTREQAAYYNLAGCCYFEMNQPEASLLLYMIAAEQDNTVAVYHFNVGLALANTANRFDEAIQHFRRAIMMEKSSTYPFNVALLFYNKRRYTEAREYFHFALEVEPYDPELHNYIGVCFSEEKNEYEAARAYSKAIDINPLNSVYHFNFGVSLKNLGDFERSIGALRASVELDSTNPAALFQLADAYLSVQSYLNASHFYQTGLQYERSSLYLNQFAVASVEAHFANMAAYEYKTLHVDERSGRARSSPVQFINDAQRLSAIHNAYAEAASRQSKHATYWWNLGNLAYQQHNLTEALNCYRQAAALTPTRADYNHMVGVVLMELHDYAAAITPLRMAAAQDKTKADYPFDLGRALTKEKRFVEACAAFQAAAKLEPLNANIQNWLATTLLDLGDWEGATQAFAKASSLDSFSNTHHILMDGMFVTVGEYEPEQNISFVVL